MTTERLEEFAVLAHILNFSKAAEKLFISQSVLSRHISELENAIGSPLFTRDSHQVSLTDEGKYFLTWITPFLQKAEHLSAALTDIDLHREKTLNILCGDQALSSRVLAFIRTYSELHPKIRLNVNHVRSQQKRALIYSVDLFISPCDYLDILRPDTEGVLLTHLQPLLVIPPSHHLGDLDEIRLDNLKGETLFVPYMEDVLGPYSRNAVAAYKKCQGHLLRVNTANDQEGLLKVELGEGVMLIPDNLKNRIYPHTRTIPVIDPDCIFPVYAYLNKTTGNTEAALFFKKLYQEFENG